MIQNEVIECDGIIVHMYQTCPAILEPIWQSLHLRLFRTATTMLSTSNHTRHHPPPELIIVAWHELDFHLVDFQNDGSFTIEL